MTIARRPVSMPARYVQRPELVILEFSSVEQDGIELMEVLADRDAETPLIILTRSRREEPDHDELA